MLLVDFVNRLNQNHPKLANRLTLPMLMQFVTLAAEVYSRAHQALKLSSSDTRILPFLELALQLQIEPTDYKALWNLTFASLPAAHLDPVALIRLHGLHGPLTTKIAKHIIGHRTTNGTGPEYTILRTKVPIHYGTRCIATLASLIGSQTTFGNRRCSPKSTYLFTNQQVPTHTAAQSFSPKLSQEMVRDAVDLFSLLRRCNRRGAVLYLPDEGEQEDRLIPAMIRELHYIANKGSKYRDHVCSFCVKEVDVKHEGTSGIKAIRAVVTDGLTIGHWRCTASSAQLEELAHRAGAPPPNGPCLNQIPKAQPCTALAVKGSKTCSNPAHVDAMAAFEIRKKKAFNLKSMLNRPDTLEIIDLDGLHQADESDRAHEAARNGGTAKPKGTPCLSRSRTHNDQLIVGTCGIILARQTFYNSEAPSALR
ncbi:uncharacterized protein MELLADRAFT_93766 [Melampsora larici-populina 98AG31]|uniref:CxC6 like cysteine cluster associated with KDZ domain-containing protein n=1 Tax=Melampsora larici-populina (strain 98AG31 / pathotype 3-4-7) TaxID=747676 RepID=F4S565_MELLP|nr:uncharacterized protein MELLADRAFT_93766 [Melampsora larici-populina 98AG31]EGG00114.1 hypothetical protein MELLADRAFT_93766 [Melampsora larici-populina 98AG31]